MIECTPDCKYKKLLEECQGKQQQEKNNELHKCKEQNKLKERIRFKGIDTPETRTRDLEEKKLGLAAKERVEEAFQYSEEFTIITEIDKKGKYGRILGTIMLPDRKVSLNQMLLDEGHAKVYV